jgi:hypothetical protein
MKAVVSSELFKHHFYVEGTFATVSVFTQGHYLKFQLSLAGREWEELSLRDTFNMKKLQADMQNFGTVERRWGTLTDTIATPEPPKDRQSKDSPQANAQVDETHPVVPIVEEEEDLLPADTLNFFGEAHSQSSDQWMAASVAHVVGCEGSNSPRGSNVSGGYFDEASGRFQPLSAAESVLSLFPSPPLVNNSDHLQQFPAPSYELSSPNQHFPALKPTTATEIEETSPTSSAAEVFSEGSGLVNLSSLSPNTKAAARKVFL